MNAAESKWQKLCQRAPRKQSLLEQDKIALKAQKSKIVIKVLAAGTLKDIPNRQAQGPVAPTFMLGSTRFPNRSAALTRRLISIIRFSPRNPTNYCSC